MSESRFRQNNLFEGDAHLDSVKVSILEKLDHTPHHIDELIIYLGFDLNKSLAAISELEIEDRIERHHDDTISLKEPDS